MRDNRGLKILILGFLLVFFGAVIPILMVIRIVEPSFFLSFLSFAASVAGVLLGIVGMAFYVRKDGR